jgi:curli biogenesis system outer membrane secretion channel CsgG
MFRIMLALALAHLVGCTSFDQRDVVKTAPSAPNPEAQAPRLPGVGGPSHARALKRKIAVAPFANETNYGAGLFADQGGHLGKQAADILVSDLTRSGKFIVFERAGLDRLRAENELMGLTPEEFRRNLIGVDALVLGSVVELGRKETGSTAVFSRTRRQIAHARITVRLVDPRTGHVFFSESGAGEASIETQTVLGVGDRAAFDATLNDKALSAAVASLLDAVLNKLSDKAWTSGVLAVDGGNVLVAGGQRQGLRVGDRLKVMTPGRRVKSPQTGLDIQLPGTQVGELEVVGFFGDSETTEGAICRIVAGAAPTPDHVVQF